MDLADQSAGLSTDSLFQAPPKSVTPQQDFNVKKAVKAAKKDISKDIKKAEKKVKLEQVVAANPGAKTLDELIKEYGMEEESAMITTGDWAAPYGDFFAGSYEEIVPMAEGYPYFDLMDLSFQGQGGAQQQQNTNMGNYNMQNMNFNAPNQGQGNMGPTFGLQQMNSFSGFGQNGMQGPSNNNMGGMQQMNQQPQHNNMGGMNGPSNFGMQNMNQQPPAMGG